MVVAAEQEGRHAGCRYSRHEGAFLRGYPLDAKNHFPTLAQALHR